MLETLQGKHGTLLTPYLQHPSPIQRIQIEMWQPWDRWMRYKLHSLRTTHASTQLRSRLFILVYIHGSKALPFCIVSDSRQHDPCGIWCYLQPAIHLIQTKYVNVIRFHLFSDCQLHSKHRRWISTFFSASSQGWNKYILFAQLVILVYFVYNMLT